MQMQNLTLLKSSAQEEQAIAQSWKAVIDMALYCKDKKIGRGCVVYELKSEAFGFMSLFDFQKVGAKELEIDTDLYSQILLEIGRYDYDSECVLLVKSEDREQIRYMLEVVPLDYDFWREIPEFANVRQRINLDQKLVARVVLAQMKAKRTSKKKNKRKK